MLSRIEITQQRALIDIRTTRAKMHIRQAPRARMRIRSTRAQMTIDRKRPSFTADWDRVWSESGRTRAGVQHSQKVWQDNYNHYMTAVNTIVSDGNRMAQIKNPANPFAEIAMRRVQGSQPEFNFDTMPLARANLTWDMGYVKIDWTNPKMEVEWDLENKPIIEYEPYAVEIFLRNRPSMHIRVVKHEPFKMYGLKLDQKV